MKTGNMGSILNRYGGLAGAGVAAYQYYGDRGVNGIIADVRAISALGIKAKIKEIIVGIAVLVGTPMLAARVPNSAMKGIIKFIGNYYGTSTILSALRSGAGSGRGYVPAIGGRRR